MLKRIISGAVFVAIVTGFFCLREFVDPRLFQILIWFVGAVGTFEMARALKDHTSKPAFIIATVFGGLIAPIYCLTEYLLFVGYGYASVLCLIALALIVITITSLALKVAGKNTLISLAPVFYPAVFVLTMLLANDLRNGFVALLLTFVIAPFSDTFAFFTGSLIGGPKLCPKLSPKKTWSGAIGGVIGGIVGSILVWVIFKPQINFGAHPLILFAIVGLVGSILTIIGDLFESFIKRKVGIKDMGKIMPGHGGVLDRFDGTFFASVLTFIVFLLV